MARLSHSCRNPCLATMAQVCIHIKACGGTGSLCSMIEMAMQAFLRRHATTSVGCLRMPPLCLQSLPPLQTATNDWYQASSHLLIWSSRKGIAVPRCVSRSQITQQRNVLSSARPTRRPTRTCLAQQGCPGQDHRHRVGDVLALQARRGTVRRFGQHRLDLEILVH